jgi:hypothetical protein
VKLNLIRRGRINRIFTAENAEVAEKFKDQNNFDDLVRSLKIRFPVIPAKAGIQFF